MQLRTRPRHFSIGSLPGPINIGGTLKQPSILPGAETVVRGGLAARTGVLFAPLAVLPTIQFGTSDNGACEQMLTEARQEAPGTKPPAPRTRRSRRQIRVICNQSSLATSERGWCCPSRASGMDWCADAGLQLVSPL